MPVANSQGCPGLCARHRVPRGRCFCMPPASPSLLISSTHGLLLVPARRLGTHLNWGRAAHGAGEPALRTCSARRVPTVGAGEQGAGGNRLLGGWGIRFAPILAAPDFFQASQSLQQSPLSTQEGLFLEEDQCPCPREATADALCFPHGVFAPHSGGGHLLRSASAGWRYLDFAAGPSLAAHRSEQGPQEPNPGARVAPLNVIARD